MESAEVNPLKRNSAFLDDKVYNMNLQLDREEQILTAVESARLNTEFIIHGLRK